MSSLNVLMIMYLSICGILTLQIAIKKEYKKQMHNKIKFKHSIVDN